MSLRVNTNVEAFDAHRNLEQTQYALAKSMQKLSSGLRINSAADDAAGLAISEKMTRADQRHRPGAAQRDGRHLARPDRRRRATTRCTRSCSASASCRCRPRTARCRRSDTAAIDQEVGQLTAELSRISANTQFNGLNILSGTLHAAGRRGPGLGQPDLVQPERDQLLRHRQRRERDRDLRHRHRHHERLERPLHPRRDPEPARGHRRQPRRLPGEHLRRAEPHPRRRRRRGDGQLHASCRSSRSPAPRCSPRRTPHRRTFSRCSRGSESGADGAAIQHAPRGMRGPV